MHQKNPVYSCFEQHLNSKIKSKSLGLFLPQCLFLTLGHTNVHIFFKVAVNPHLTKTKHQNTIDSELYSLLVHIDSSFYVYLIISIYAANY